MRAVLLLASCAAAAGCLLAPAPPPGAGPGDAGADGPGDASADGGDGGPPLPLAQATYIKIPAPTASDQAGDAVALSGDGLTLAIGVPGEDGSATGVGGAVDDLAPNAGAVFVYGYDATAGTWSLQAYLKPSNTESGDRFGAAVALSTDGTTLAVGAPGEDSDGSNQANNTASAAGAVYVFARAAGWSQQAYLKAPSAGAGDGFGAAVAMTPAGDRVVIGAPSEAGGSPTDPADDSAPNAGAAYVFSRIESDWDFRAYVKAPVIAAEDRFGTAVALSADGSTLAVGAIGDDGAATGIADVGAVHVYAATAATAPPTFSATVRAPAPTASANFGGAVALSRFGDRLLVGAAGENSTAEGVDGTGTPTAPRAGAAFLLERTGPVWTPEAYIKASNTGMNDQFGASVAMTGDGDNLLVGAPIEGSAATGIDGDQASDAAANAGAAYLFTRTPATQQLAYIKASNTLPGHSFGGALAISDDGRVLVIGARGENGGGSGIGEPQAPTAMSDGTGAVYVFRR